MQTLLEVLTEAYCAAYCEVYHISLSTHLEATFEHPMVASVLPMATSTPLEAASEELGSTIQMNPMAVPNEAVILPELD